MIEIPNYMTIFTLYVLFLPFLLLYSISFARKKQIKKHIISQSLILVASLIFIVYFEIMVRLDGGFIKYADNSSLPFAFILIFLIVHILIAIAATAGWLYLFIKSAKEYKNKGFKTFSFNHKRIGRSVFMAITISSFMGICIYLFLFIL